MSSNRPTDVVQATAARPLARALALVALLCVGAMQLQEAGHSHWSGQDDTVHCLVCKSSAGTAIAVNTPEAIALGMASPVSAAVAFHPFSLFFSPFLARGPPQLS